MTGLVWSAFGFAAAPLVWLIYVVITNGLPALSADFLTTHAGRHRR